MVPGSFDWATSARGWLCGLLPFMEQPEIFDILADNDFNLQDPQCQQVMEFEWTALYCPSDNSSRGLSTQQYQWGQGGNKATWSNFKGVALTNYKGVIGDPKMSDQWGGSEDRHYTSPNVGMFWRYSYMDPVTFDQITDGLSNTFMVGEDVPMHNHHSVWAYSNGDWSSCHAPLNYMPDPPRPDDWWDVIGFRSLHPGGAHFCMADGSVHFVEETIDYDLYRGFSTRAGGEVGKLP